MSDSDSDDTFVVLGTPLKPYEEDEPVKKQYDIQNQKVKDARGRQRFHGAFTGGFSAGYFNTVGSKEGWTPSGFVSSRASRMENAQRRPEDFMDEEDLGEYGIAPRLIKATDEFRSVEPKAVKRPFVTGGLIPGEAPLATLIKPASSSMTMGIRLLRKLGWRDGQGVGPRIRKKKKKRKQTEDNKVYGCSLPGIEKNQGSSSEDEVPDLIPTDLTFAPKDITPIDFKPKDNLYGLGYSGLRVGHETSNFQLFDELPEVAGSKGKQGIRGQAFGVGALEEDDDDIYTSDKFSNYDRVLGGPDNTGTYGWTAPTNKGGNDNKDYADTVLEGFKLMSTRLQPRKVYPPPQLPRDFKPYHVFTEQENATTRMAQEIPKKFSMTWKKMDVSDRREALGEKPDIKSVFDLINEKDKQHMSSCQTAVTPAVSSSSQPNEQIEKAKAALMMGITSRFQSVGTEVISPTGEQTSSPSSSSPQPDTSEPKENTPLYKGSAGFKPFASDPEKQARYEKYLASKAKGNTDDYEHDAGHMTEWEKSREKDEFARASQLYKPMSSLMASRFTRAEFKDEDKVLVNKEQGGDGSDQAEAARMKMYGQLTHDTLEWHPDKLLCKRFNVPNPYPESSVVGLPKVKRDKFSIFNFLTIPGEESKRTDQALSLVNEENVEPHERKGVCKKKLGQQGKPLAILASVDLRQSSHKSESNQSSQDQEAVGEEETELKTDQLDDGSSVLPSCPPPDIFKAVFGDSDPEDSSSEDENDEESVEKETIGLSQVDAKPLMDEMPHNLMDSSDSSVHKQTSQMEVYDSFGVKIELPKSGLLYGTSGKEPSIQTIDRKESVDGVVPNTDLCDAYGPPLPPGLGQNNDNCVQAKSNFPPTTQPGLHRKKKKRKEEKCKHKKKGKHKKHKEKHKKKKKTREVIVIGTPSGSEADTEDSYSSNPDTEKSVTERTSKFQVLHQR